MQTKNCEDGICYNNGNDLPGYLKSPYISHAQCNSMLYILGNYTNKCTLTIWAQVPYFT